MLFAKLTSREDCEKPWSEVSLSQHGEDHGLCDHPVLVGGPHTEVSEQSQQDLGRFPPCKISGENCLSFLLSVSTCRDDPGWESHVEHNVGEAAAYLSNF